MNILVILIVVMAIAMVRTLYTTHVRDVIRTAIYTYHVATKNKDSNGHVLYTDMESYKSTYWRFWDWSYANVLKTSKYIIIKPYINGNIFYTKLWILIPVILICVMISVLGFGNDNSVEGSTSIPDIPQIESVVPNEQPEPSKPAEPTPTPPADPVEPDVKYDVIPPEQTTENKVLSSYEDALRYIARTVWGEARGCSTEQKAAVIWCILNRVDAGYSKTGNVNRDIINVVTQAGAFHGHSFNNPVTDEIYALTVDVVTRWEREKAGETAVGRILPKGYLWFRSGGNGTNVYRNAYTNGQIWDWSLESPYK